MDKLRMRYSKNQEASYMSHLDLMRTMQRAFQRAGYALKYSEGFNPHPQISVLLPLPTCMASRCELMDFQLKEEADLAEMPGHLTAVMPKGIEVTEVYPAVRKVKELKYIRAAIRFDYDHGRFAEMQELLDGFFRRESIVVTRRTKRGEGPFDIAPHIRQFEFMPRADHVHMNVWVSAQEPTLNPELLITALRQLLPEAAPDYAGITRTETFDENLEIFR